MVWKTFVGPLAMTSRRRGLATAVIYGLSLTVRFTSATGEEWKFRPNPYQGPTPGFHPD